MMNKYKIGMAFLLVLPVLFWMVEFKMILVEFGLEGLYLPAHVLLEVASIIISFMVFSIVWVSRKKLLSNNLVILSGLFLSVSLLDMLHMLSYAGMPELLTNNTPDKYLWFWNAARVCAVLALFLLSISPDKRRDFDFKLNDQVIFFSSLAVVGLVSWFVFFRSEFLVFLYGKFEVNLLVENFVVVLAAISSYFFWKKKDRSIYMDNLSLSIAALLVGITEFWFIAGHQLFSFGDLVGHFYKIVAYWFLYRAIVVSVIEMPYLNLENAKDSLNVSSKASNTTLWSWNITKNQVVVSDGFVDLYDQGSGLNVVKSWLDVLSEMLVEEDKERVLNKIKLILKAKDDVPYEDEFRVKRDDGSIIHVFSRGEKRVNKLDGCEYFVGANVDITIRKEKETQVNILANFDSLTSLPNRNMLQRVFGEMIELNDKVGTSLGVMFLDLDNFKNINDSLGHRAGDELLVEVAKRLSTAVDGAGVVSRIGGDEFVVLIGGIDKGNEHAVVEGLIHKLMKLTSTPFLLLGHEFVLTPSIGVSFFPENGRTFHDLAQAADVAMYNSKFNGKNTFCFFNEEMKSDLFRRLRIQSELHGAKDRAEFSLLYQPQFNIESGANKLVGLEALIRWNNKSLGVVMPAEFIPISEDSGVVIEIGNWVLEESCRQIREWLDAGLPVVPVCVNVSPVQFRNVNLVSFIKKCIEKYSIEPKYLRIELTEGAMMKNPESAKKILTELNDFGIKLLIDDFGTGYSSMSYLGEFDIHKLKIDQVFVKDVLTKDSARAVIRAIIDLAKNFKFKTIAEGVETKEQLELMREYGCQEAQGFLLGEPIGGFYIRKLLAGSNT